MAFIDLFKVSRKTFFNPTAWFGYEQFKQQNATIYQVIKTMFTKPKPKREESFEQAIERLGITEEEFNTVKENYRFYYYLFTLLGVLSTGYAGYLLVKHFSFTGLILAISVTALFFAQAFRFNFWLLQMEQRKLGLTIEDWKRSRFGKKGL